MKMTTTLIAAIFAAATLPGVLSAQNQPTANPAQPAQSQAQPQQPGASAQNQSAPGSTQPEQSAMTPPAAPPAAAQPAQSPAQEIKQDAHALIKEERKTEASELKVLKDREQADISSVKAKGLAATEEYKQLDAIRDDYARKRRDLRRKYRAERKTARKELRKDMKKSAPAGQ